MSHLRVFARVAVFVLSLVSCLSVAAQTKQEARPDSPAPQATTSPAPDPDVQAPAGQPEADTDSADIPPFARGKIDERTYFELRDRQIRMMRGIDDLLRMPQARANAIHTLERQEQEMVNRFRAQAAKRAAGIAAPIVPVPTWTPIGPSPIPNGQTNGINELPVSGRAIAIAIDPADSNTVYIGTAQGGLFRSMDGGTTWTALMDSAASLAIGAITIDPTNHNNVWVGTGEGNLSADSFFGVGLYLIQGATTATPTVSGPFHSTATADVMTGRAISRILVNPANNNQILVSTTSGFSGLSSDTLNLPLPPRGIYMSSNALSPAPVFSLVSTPWPANRLISDMTMDPQDATRIVVHVFGNPVANDGGLWTVTSGSVWAGTAAWSQTRTVSADNARFAVNVSGTTPTTTMFAVFDETVSCGAGTASGTLFKSVSPFTTWTQVSGATGFCGSQCFYDMAPAVKTDDVNTILVGGSANSGTAGSCGANTMIRSTDGAAFAASSTSLHADSHATAFAVNNPLVVYAVDDGGVFKSTDGGVTWSSLNNAGLNTAQFESVAVHPTDANYTIGGTQDNGTEFQNSSSAWIRADFGDGGFSAIDQNATDTTNVTMYHTYFNAQNSLIGFARLISSASVAVNENNWNAFLGCEGTSSDNGIACGDSVLFYAPMVLGPGNPNTVYFGTNQLYRSADRGNTMPSVSQVFAADVSAIGISRQDDNVRIVGLVNGSVLATTTGANPLTDVTGPWGPHYVARVVIDPSNSSTAYVALDGYGFASHVWKTTNLTGSPATATWTAASSGLPDVPVNAFVVDPANSSILYAGTDIGVFNSIDGGATWNAFGTGLPRVAVFDMAIQPTSHKLRIATHGRGMWEIAGAVAALASSAGVTVSPSANPAFGTNLTFTATISGAGPVPTGSVTFKDGATALGPAAALDGTGKATFATSALLAGPHNITAVYSGDTNYSGSTSTVLSVTVIADARADYSVSGNPTSATVTAGQSASVTITLTPAFGFNNTVNFTCTGLPAFSTCSFSPATVPMNGTNPSTTTLTISTTVRTAAPPSGNLAALKLFGGAGFLGVVLAGGLASRKRRWKLVAMILLLTALIAGMVSCGGGGGGSTTTTVTHTGTPAGASTVVVNATSGTTTHPLNITLNVQ